MPVKEDYFGVTNRSAPKLLIDVQSEETLVGQLLVELLGEARLRVFCLANSLRSTLPIQEVLGQLLEGCLCLIQTKIHIGSSRGEKITMGGNSSQDPPLFSCSTTYKAWLKVSGREERV